MTGNVPIALTTVPGLFFLKPDAQNTQGQLIKRMGTGFVLTYSLDLFHSVNIASGQFSVPCGGYFVQNGETAGSVSQMTVAGSLRDLFTAVEAVGDDLDFDDFYFRNYCVGSPSALLRGLKFSG
jgi:PmbA protein